MKLRVAAVIHKYHKSDYKLQTQWLVKHGAETFLFLEVLVDLEKTIGVKDLTDSHFNSGHDFRNH